jgi:hypothetical protein
VKGVEALEGVLVDLSFLFIISYLSNDVTLDNNNQKLRYHEIGGSLRIRIHMHTI